MTEDRSDMVFRYFESCSRDLTPAAVKDRVNVLYAPCSNDLEVTSICASVLTESELCRAGRFALQADRQRFIQRRAFRRFCAAAMARVAPPLSGMVFDKTENGRPYLAGLPGCWFSFSSSGRGLLAAQSSTCAVGVDLEDRTRDLEITKLARHFFSADEASAVEQLCEPERLQCFLRLWCLKEAALKSIGEGLPFGLDVFQFETEPVLRIVRTPAEYGEPERFSAHFVERSDICAALVLRDLGQGDAGVACPDRFQFEAAEVE